MKKLLILGGSAAALLLCILFGAFFAGPMMASASSAVNTLSLSTAGKTGAKDTYCDQYQQDLAKRLGVSADTLQQDRKGAYEDVLAQLVKDGKLTQKQADAIKQRVESHKGCSGFNADRVARALELQAVRKHRSEIVSQVAQGLHLSASQLEAQLRAGKSLNQIAQAQHVSTSDLKTTVTSAINSALDKAASAGELTQAQANAAKQYLHNHPGIVNHLLAQHKHDVKKATK